MDNSIIACSFFQKLLVQRTKNDTKTYFCASNSFFCIHIQRYYLQASRQHYIVKLGSLVSHTEWSNISERNSNLTLCPETLLCPKTQRCPDTLVCPITNCLLQVVFFLLPAAYFQLPITNYQRPNDQITSQSHLNSHTSLTPQNSILAFYLKFNFTI